MSGRRRRHVETYRSASSTSTVSSKRQRTEEQVEKGGGPGEQEFIFVFDILYKEGGDGEGTGTSNQRHHAQGILNAKTSDKFYDYTVLIPRTNFKHETTEVFEEHNKRWDDYIKTKACHMTLRMYKSYPKRGSNNNIIIRKHVAIVDNSEVEEDPKKYWFQFDFNFNTIRVNLELENFPLFKVRFADTDAQYTYFSDFVSRMDENLLQQDSVVRHFL
jgi:hypothetical protein